jgi:lysophospholipase L1-like esterase
MPMNNPSSAVNPGSFNISPTMLPKYRYALGSMRDGDRNVRVLKLGDSTTAGFNATNKGLIGNPRAKNMPVQLAAMLNSYFAPSSAHTIFGDSHASVGFSTYDTRMTLGTGWVIYQGSNNPWFVGLFGNSTPSSGNLSFTPTGNVDTFVIWYLTSPGEGTFTCNVDGGSTLATVNANAASSLSSVTVTAGSVGAHTLNIQKTSATGVNYIYGIEAYDSTTKCIQIMQMARIGGASGGMLQNNQPYDALNALPILKPDLITIDLTINSWAVTPNETPAQFTSNMQTIINAAKATADVILCTGVPSRATVASLATQRGIVQALYGLASYNNLPLIDHWSRWGSWEALSPLGMYGTDQDNLHPAYQGYSDKALAEFTVLTSLR